MTTARAPSIFRKGGALELTTPALLLLLLLLLPAPAPTPALAPTPNTALAPTPTPALAPTPNTAPILNLPIHELSYSRFIGAGQLSNGTLSCFADSSGL